MQTSSAAVASLVLAAAAGACQFEPDSVAPGYYGTMEAGRVAPAGASGRSGGIAAPPLAAAGATGPSAAGSASPPPPASSAGSSSPPFQPNPAAGASGSGGGATVPPLGPAARGACDLTGRWVVTMHLVSDALGELQYGHYFHYFEIVQTGDRFAVEKGILCGFDSVGLGAFASTADFRPAWAAVASKQLYNGWAGSSVAAGGGCKIDLPKWVSVRGATIAHYRDPAVPLPTAEEKATETTPGWEDWDGDGNPGLTGMISGIVTGKIFTAPRLWMSIAATVPERSGSFRLPVQWNQEQNVMAYDGTPLLGSEAVRAADASLHFAELARLPADEATGDDAAICKRVIELAPTLTPAAAAN